MLFEGFGYVFDLNDGHILSSRIIANHGSSGFNVSANKRAHRQAELLFAVHDFVCL
jgi:hypothetical protein